MTPYARRRFKGPVGSPLIVPILTLESSASRSRPRRIGRFRRRTILRRFVPHPRKMANMRRLVLAKASHTRPNRWGRLAPPTAGSASRVAVSTNASVRPSLSSAKNSPTARSRLRRSVLAGRKGRASHRHRSGLKIPARPLAAPASPAVGGARPLLHWPASPSEERAGLPALASATRPSVFLLTPQSPLRASSVTCASMRNF